MQDFTVTVDLTPPAYNDTTPVPRSHRLEDIATRNRSLDVRAILFGIGIAGIAVLFARGIVG